MNATVRALTTSEVSDDEVNNARKDAAVTGVELELLIVGMVSPWVDSVLNGFLPVPIRLAGWTLLTAPRWTEGEVNCTG